MPVLRHCLKRNCLVKKKRKCTNINLHVNFHILTHLQVNILMALKIVNLLFWIKPWYPKKRKLQIIIFRVMYSIIKSAKENWIRSHRIHRLCANTLRFHIIIVTMGLMREVFILIPQCLINFTLKSYKLDRVQNNVNDADDDRILDTVVSFNLYEKEPDSS